MKKKLLLIPGIIVLLSACSTAYKSGQTPDDVYFSPVKTYRDEDNKNNDRDQVDQVSYEEHNIRMGINNYRWRTFDNDYAYNPYRYGYNNGYYYNPYYCPYPVYSYYNTYTPVKPVNNTPRTVNLSTYKNGYNNENIITKPISKYNSGQPARSYNNSNNNYSNKSNSSGSSDSNNRTYTPSSSDTKSSSSGSSSSGTISRPGRNGR